MVIIYIRNKMNVSVLAFKKQEFKLEMQNIHIQKAPTEINSVKKKHLSRLE